MAKRNRRCKTFRMKAATLGLATLIAFIVAPWIVYSLLLMHTDQVGSQIRLLEREKRALNETRRRQEAEWNQLAEPRRLDEAMASRGLRLAYAPPERTATVLPNGQMRLARPVYRALELAKQERQQSGDRAQARNRR
ncbi:MAG: hypothetical protein MSB12_01295 [Lentisphaeraceae bacterium]|nr:hypothetical protein [Lentisphaeraceae bacterium]